jgi:hypothetical protein
MNCQMVALTGATAMRLRELGPKCQGGGGITVYGVSPYAFDGAPTVGTAQIGRGAVLQGSAAT